MDETTTDAIQRITLELAETRAKMKAIRDDLKDIAEQNDEYRALQEKLLEAAENRTKARKLLDEDRDYQAVNSELEDLRFKYKDLEEILSHHLVSHFSETQGTDVEVGGDKLQIILKAKLGK